MIKLEVRLSIGFPGASLEEELEIDDDEVEGMDPEKREAYLEAEVKEWAFNFIEWGYKELENDDSSI